MSPSSPLPSRHAHRGGPASSCGPATLGLTASFPASGLALGKTVAGPVSLVPEASPSVRPQPTVSTPPNTLRRSRLSCCVLFTCFLGFCLFLCTFLALHGPPNSTVSRLISKESQRDDSRRRGRGRTGTNSGETVEVSSTEAEEAASFLRSFGKWGSTADVQQAGTGVEDGELKVGKGGFGAPSGERAPSALHSEGNLPAPWRGRGPRNEEGTWTVSGEEPPNGEEEGSPSKSYNPEARPSSAGRHPGGTDKGEKGETGTYGQGRTEAGHNGFDSQLHLLSEEDLLVVDDEEARKWIELPSGAPVRRRVWNFADEEAEAAAAISSPTHSPSEHSRVKKDGVGRTEADVADDVVVTFRRKPPGGPTGEDGGDSGTERIERKELDPFSDIFLSSSGVSLFPAKRLCQCFRSPASLTDLLKALETGAGEGGGGRTAKQVKVDQAKTARGTTASELVLSETGRGTQATTAGGRQQSWETAKETRTPDSGDHLRTKRREGYTQLSIEGVPSFLATTVKFGSNDRKGTVEKTQKAVEELVEKVEAKFGFSVVSDLPALFPEAFVFPYTFRRDAKETNKGPAESATEAWSSGVARARGVSVGGRAEEEEEEEKRAGREEVRSVHLASLLGSPYAPATAVLRDSLLLESSSPMSGFEVLCSVSEKAPGPPVERLGFLRDEGHEANSSRRDRTGYSSSVQVMSGQSSETEAEERRENPFPGSYSGAPHPVAGAFNSTDAYYRRRGTPDPGDASLQGGRRVVASVSESIASTGTPAGTEVELFNTKGSSLASTSEGKPYGHASSSFFFPSSFAFPESLCRTSSLDDILLDYSFPPVREAFPSLRPELTGLESSVMQEQLLTSLFASCAVSEHRSLEGQRWKANASSDSQARGSAGGGTVRREEESGKETRRAKEERRGQGGDEEPLQGDESRRREGTSGKPVSYVFAPLSAATLSKQFLTCTKTELPASRTPAGEKEKTEHQKEQTRPDEEAGEDQRLEGGRMKEEDRSEEETPESQAGKKRKAGGREDGGERRGQGKEGKEDAPGDIQGDQRRPVTLLSSSTTPAGLQGTGWLAAASRAASLRVELLQHLAESALSSRPHRSEEPKEETFRRLPLSGNSSLSADPRQSGSSPIRSLGHRRVFWLAPFSLSYISPSALWSPAVGKPVADSSQQNSVRGAAAEAGQRTLDLEAGEKTSVYPVVREADGAAKSPNDVPRPERGVARLVLDARVVSSRAVATSDADLLSSALSQDSAPLANVAAGRPIAEEPVYNRQAAESVARSDLLTKSAASSFHLNGTAKQPAHFGFDPRFDIALPPVTDLQAAAVIFARRARSNRRGVPGGQEVEKFAGIVLGVVPAVFLSAVWGGAHGPFLGADLETAGEESAAQKASEAAGRLLSTLAESDGPLQVRTADAFDKEVRDTLSAALSAQRGFILGLFRAMWKSGKKNPELFQWLSLMVRAIASSGGEGKSETLNGELQEQGRQMPPSVSEKGVMERTAGGATFPSAHHSPKLRGASQHPAVHEDKEGQFDGFVSAFLRKMEDGRPGALVFGRRKFDVVLFTHSAARGNLTRLLVESFCSQGLFCSGERGKQTSRSSRKAETTQSEERALPAGQHEREPPFSQAVGKGGDSPGQEAVKRLGAQSVQNLAFYDVEWVVSQEFDRGTFGDSGGLFVKEEGAIPKDTPSPKSASISSQASHKSAPSRVDTSVGEVERPVEPDALRSAAEPSYVETSGAKNESSADEWMRHAQQNTAREKGSDIFPWAAAAVKSFFTSRATFCLCPQEGWLPSKCIFEALAHSCIPVVVGGEADLWLPGACIFDWLRVAVFVSGSHAQYTPSILSLIPDDEILERQKMIWKVRKHFLYDLTSLSESRAGGFGFPRDARRNPPLYADARRLAMVELFMKWELCDGEEP